MNLTSKSRYALKIMMDLAHYGAIQPLVRRNDIAIRQGIPTDYLDQIMIKLRSGNLVESVRGRSGGYRLARDPLQITMWDVFSTVEGSMIPVECIGSGHACDFEASCSSKDAWNTIFSAVKVSLGSITLSRLASDWAAEAVGSKIIEGLLPNVRECRGGSYHASLEVGRLVPSAIGGARIDG
jgi:Rrf2 family protein